VQHIKYIAFLYHLLFCFTILLLSATEYHLGLLKAKLAKYRAQLLEPGGKAGAKVSNILSFALIWKNIRLVLYIVSLSLVCYAVLYFMFFRVEFLMLNIPIRTLWFYVFTYILKFCFCFSCCLYFIICSVFCILLCCLVHNKLIDCTHSVMYLLLLISNVYWIIDKLNMQFFDILLWSVLVLCRCKNTTFEIL